MPLVQPSSLQPCENMVHLEELNEGAILHNLRMRYEQNDIYVSTHARTMFVWIVRAVLEVSFFWGAVLRFGTVFTTDVHLLDIDQREPVQGFAHIFSSSDGYVSREAGYSSSCPPARTF